MKKMIQKFHQGEEGATMVEYGLMVALIAIVAMVAATFLGTAVNDIFQECADALGYVAS